MSTKAEWVRSVKRWYGPRCYVCGHAASRHRFKHRLHPIKMSERARCLGAPSKDTIHRCQCPGYAESAERSLYNEAVRARKEASRNRTGRDS